MAVLLAFLCFVVFISLFFAFKSHRFGHQLAHIVPVGIIQFADFVSDLFVLAGTYYFYYFLLAEFHYLLPTAYYLLITND